MIERQLLERIAAAMRSVSSVRIDGEETRDSAEGQLHRRYVEIRVGEDTYREEADDRPGAAPTQRLTYRDKQYSRQADEAPWTQPDVMYVFMGKLEQGNDPELSCGILGRSLGDFAGGSLIERRVVNGAPCLGLSITREVDHGGLYQGMRELLERFPGGVQPDVIREVDQQLEAMGDRTTIAQELWVDDHDRLTRWQMLARSYRGPELIETVAVTEQYSEWNSAALPGPLP